MSSTTNNDKCESFLNEWTDGEPLYPTFNEIMSASLLDEAESKLLTTGSTIQLDLPHDSNEEALPEKSDEALPEKSDDNDDFCQSALPACLSSTECQHGASNAPLIEVCPGVFLKLRGSSETWHALQAGRVVKTNCHVCERRLWCIQDAEFVLCPDCRVVSPIEGRAGIQGGGLGLGLRTDE